MARAVGMIESRGADSVPSGDEMRSAPRKGNPAMHCAECNYTNTVIYISDSSKRAARFSWAGAVFCSIRI